MAVQPPLKRSSGNDPMELFRDNLTPSRNHLLHTVRRGITNRRLRTNDLMLLFVHLREIGFEAFSEWGHSVAHIRRNRGALWKQAVDIWAAHIYFKELDWKSIPLARLPVHVFETFLWLIDYLSDWQFRTDFAHIYPHGITREEAKETLHHLYSRPARPKNKRKPDEKSGFVFLVNEKTSDPRDLAFVRKLIRICDVDALNVPPVPMSEYVGRFENVLRRLGATPWRLNAQEKVYLQLHFLICLHHTMIDVDYDILRSVISKPITAYTPVEESSDSYTAMIAVSAMRQNLSLDIAFYFREKNGSLDQVDLESGDTRYPNLSYPIITTDLAEHIFLVESDDNIRACLFNHPLDVRIHGGQPRLVALDRMNCPFPITRTRTKRRRPGSGDVKDFLETFAPI